MNMAVRPVSDCTQYGYADFWASPSQTLGSGAGDCEDCTIVKYVPLRGLGILPDDLRLMIVQDEKRGSCLHWTEERHAGNRDRGDRSHYKSRI